jgi:hypothetical protein
LVSNFSRSLIGGDVAGLDALAMKLKLYPPQAQSVIDALDGRVEGLVHDAGWWGDAADHFKRRWKGDAITAEVLKKVVVAVSGIVFDLAGILRTLESVLEQAADDARAAGVPVTPYGDLLPLPPDASPSVLQAATVYSEIQRYAMATARRARLQATDQLQAVESMIGPPSNPQAAALPPDAWASAGDSLMTLYALPSSAGRNLRARIPELRHEREAALDRWREARDQARLDKTKIPDDIKVDHKATLQALNEANAELDSVERFDSRWTKLIDLRISDVTPGLKAASEASRAARFLGDVPVVDVAAGIVATGLLSYDDMQKGDDWSAVPKEASAQAAGIVAGVAAGVAVGVVVVGGAALIGVSAPVIVVVGAAAIVGGVVAFGVGDAVSNAWHEHWDEDIHQYGVVGGVGHGLANVGTNTLKDFGHVKDAIGSTATNLWKGIFGH